MTRLRAAGGSLMQFGNAGRSICSYIWKIRSARLDVSACHSTTCWLPPMSVTEGSDSRAENGWFVTIDNPLDSALRACARVLGGSGLARPRDAGDRVWRGGMAGRRAEAEGYRDRMRAAEVAADADLRRDHIAEAVRERLDDGVAGERRAVPGADLAEVGTGPAKRHVGAGRPDYGHRQRVLVTTDSLWPPFTSVIICG